MKLQTDNFGFEGQLPGNRMGAKIKTSAKLFDVLSSGIYADPILAPIRELSCNAYDAHVAAGYPERPFNIFVPSWMEPTFYVEDFGTGIPPEQFSDIFYTYGASTKSDSDDFIGALGLGSKSPFAYTKSSFLVRNRYEGFEYTYLCFINENGEPDGSLVGTVETTEANGVKVEFGVKNDDVYTFRLRLESFFSLWQGTMPTFLNTSGDDVKIKPAVKALEGNDWYLDSTSGKASSNRHAVAMMGNVPYKIDSASIAGLPAELKVFCDNCFVINFPMGSLNFSASREGLKYDESTRKKLIDRLNEVRNDISNTFMKTIQASSDQVSFINCFNKTFEEFRTLVTAARLMTSDLEYYTKMLLNKRLTDVIEFQGAVYQLRELINGTFTRTVDSHQSFSISTAVARGKRDRTFLDRSTLITYRAKAVIEASFFDDLNEKLKKSASTRTFIPYEAWEAGKTHAFMWRDTAPPRNKKTLTDFVIHSHHLFDKSTQHNIKMTAGHELTFIVNDVGSSGETRFKLFFSEKRNKSMHFVDFNPKVTDITVIEAELKKFISEGFKGAKIQMLSKLPDLRAPIQKAPVEAGTIKTKVLINDETTKLGVFNFTAHGIGLKINSPTILAFTLKTKEVIEKIADLQAQDVVLYVIKRRSPTNFYDDTVTQSPTIINNRQFMNLAHALGMFKEAISNGVLKIQVLGEGQVALLKKRGVKLKSVKEFILEKINKMQADEKFIEALDKTIGVTSCELLSSLHEIFGANKNYDDTSVYQQALETYRQALTAKSLLNEKLAKCYIYSTLNFSHIELGRKVKIALNKQLIETYPLLQHIRLSSISSSSVRYVKEYLAGVDQKSIALVESVETDVVF